MISNMSIVSNDRKDRTHGVVIPDTLFLRHRLGFATERGKMIVSSINTRLGCVEGGEMTTHLRDNKKSSLETKCEIPEHRVITVGKSLLDVDYKDRGGSFTLTLCFNPYEDGDVIQIIIESWCDCCSAAQIDAEDLKTLDTIGFVSSFSYTNDSLTLGDQTFAIREVGPNSGYYPPQTSVSLVKYATATCDWDIYSDDEDAVDDQ